MGEAEIEALLLLHSTAYRLAQQEPPIRRRGRRPKRGALGIAERASFAYEMVTNKRPTITVYPINSKAGGAFLDLVEDIFRLTSIDANAEHYAKKALKDVVPGTADEDLTDKKPPRVPRITSF